MFEKNTSLLAFGSPIFQVVELLLNLFKVGEEGLFFAAAINIFDNVQQGKTEKLINIFLPVVSFLYFLLSQLLLDKLFLDQRVCPTDKEE